MKKILVIDDQKDNITTISAVIKNNIQDCKILKAMSGKEGLKIARKEQPDTILLDIIMPKMDGFETCERLKKDELTKHIPVVIVTAIKTDVESRIKGLNMGADAFLTKPIDATELTAQVNVMLRIKAAEEKLRADKKTLEELVLEKTFKLKESEEKFSKSFYNHPTPMQILNIKTGERIDVNKSCLKLIGYSHEEFITGNIFVNNVAFSQNRLKELISMIQEKEHISDEYFPMIKKSGETITTIVTAAKLNIGDGNTVIFSFMDITEREKTQRQLMESETRFKALHNASFGGIAIHNKGIILDCNQGLSDISGYTTEELIGVDGVKLLIAEESHETVMANIKASYEKAYEVVGIRKNGDKYPLRLEARMIPYEGKKIRVVEFRDITEQKNAEKAIIESEERYRSLVVNLPVGIFRSTFEGKVISANPAMAKMYGYDSVEELLNVPAKDYYTNENPREKILGELMKKGYLLGYETMEKTKNGSLIWVSINYKASLKKDGGIDYIDGVIIDITKRKKAELELNMALNKATESDRLKSAFLATMSHELRTPLNAIIGFSDIIDEDLPVEEIVGFAKTINASGNHLLSIVEDLFDITLIEAGETKIYKREENLNTILLEVHEIIQSEKKAINKNNLDLLLDIPKETESLIINTDPSKLKQILINLLKNALKFTHKGHVHYGYSIKTDTGQPVLSLVPPSKAEVSKESRNVKLTEIEFFVEDTGIGVPKDKQEIIFDAFRQVNETHTKIYGGTGIGLSISKKLTKLLGGKIWIESSENKGSTFYFTLPFERQTAIDEITEENTKSQLKTKQKSKQKTETILIVEDDESSFEFLKVILTKLGINIIWAKNGKDAVKCCKEKANIDLILMDINIPIMNGYEATKLIKKINPHLPIIAQTAYAIIGDRQKSIDAGCDDYISKPIKKQELIAKIEKLLSS